MMILQNLYPDATTDSVYRLDWEELSARYDGVIFDIDNTLVPHGAPADERAVKLFARIHGLGMRTMLVSNNGRDRVEPFARTVESGCVCRAAKPGRRGYEEAVRRMGVTRARTLFVGDQIFTDIWGANRAGLYTILTEPVESSTDEPQIVLKRLFERPFRHVRGGVREV